MKLPVLSSAVLALAVGFSLSLPASAVVGIVVVEIGHAGNASDPATDSLYGAVASAYWIGKYEVTNAQYTEFLNAVDPTGANPNGIYNSSMGIESVKRGGISFNAGAANGSKYTIRTNMGDKPVNHVSWFDAARFINWLHNGQGSGSTETGAYTLNGNTNTVPKNAGAKFWLPSENEWYKAAYFDPTSGAGGGDNYWTYATRSDTAPTGALADASGNVSNPGGNVANHLYAADWNSQNGHLTTVGSAAANNYFGTADMNGNVWELIDAGSGASRVVRGGAWDTGNTGGEVGLASSARGSVPLANEWGNIGFRVASRIANLNYQRPTTQIFWYGDQATCDFGYPERGSFNDGTYWLNYWPPTGGEEAAFFAELPDPWQSQGTTGAAPYKIYFGDFTRNGTISCADGLTPGGPVSVGSVFVGTGDQWEFHFNSNSPGAPSNSAPLTVLGPTIIEHNQHPNPGSFTTPYHIIPAGPPKLSIYAGTMTSGPVTVGGVGTGTLKIGTDAILSSPLVNVGQGGLLSGKGRVRGLLKVFGGKISPGNSIGTLTVEGDIEMDADSEIIMEVGGLSPGVSHDQLLATGTLSLAGTVRIQFTDGFMPQVGDSLALFGTTEIEGSNNVTFVSDTGVEFARTGGPNSPYLTVVSLPTIWPQFQLWRQAKFGNTSSWESEPLADMDGDTADNFQEFLFNMNPLVADHHSLEAGSGSSGFPVGLIVGSGAERRFAFEFIRHKSAGPYIIQTSTDLQTWTAEALPLETPVSVSDDYERVRVLDHPVAEEGHPEPRFFRISVSDPGLVPLWNIETVDSAGDVGSHTSLAFGPDGQPAISYYDATNGDLKFARFNGAAWLSATIDSPGDLGQYTSLAFGLDGQPAISYYDVSNTNLKFARFNGTSWSVTTIDSVGDVGKYSSLAIGPDGHPSVSYFDDTDFDLKFTRFNGTVWSPTTVDSNGFVGEFTSLAFGPDGQPAISYWDAYNGYLKLARFNGTAWMPTAIALFGYVGAETSLAFGPNGQPAISHLDPFDGDLRFSSFDGSWWSDSTIDSAGFVGGSNSLAFGPNGRVAISYLDGTNGDLKFYGFQGTVSSSSTIDSSGFVGIDTSLAFDPDGQPAISYYDATNGNLKFARKTLFAP